MLLQVARKLDEVRAGDHICHIYQNDRERQAVVIPFIWQGLKRNEAVLCVLDTISAEETLSLLGYEQALPYLNGAQLRFWGSQEFYTAHGVFQVEAALETLCQQRQRAQEQGFQGLRVVSEMSWILRHASELNTILTFESQLNERLPHSGCIMLCLYDGRRFGTATLNTMVRTHPTSTQGEQLRENRAYVIYTHHSPLEEKALETGLR